jgi:hypothetical protein
MVPGNPLDYARVRIIQGSSIIAPRRHEDGAKRHQGILEFDHVAPGLYSIVFNNSNRFDPNLPYLRTFYPNAPDFETAMPITIGKDELINGPQEVLNADIHVIGDANHHPNPRPKD